MGRLQLLGQNISGLGLFAIDAFLEAEVAFEAYRDVVRPLRDTPIRPTLIRADDLYVAVRS